jgi:hypothetical protein
MTDTPEPEADDERIDLRPTGLVRIFIEDDEGTKRYRLRRPFFGELKAMRLAMEHVVDEIDDVRERTIADGQALAEEAKAAADNAELPDEERRQTIDKLKRRGRELAHDLIDQADELRLEWWSKVFDTVSLDGTPEQMPGWIVDPNLMQKLMAHWRAAPFRSVD